MDHNISKTIDEIGSGPGCHGHVIEFDGFKISGLISKDENFLGVNISGTENKWDPYSVEWKIQAYSGNDFIAQDSRKIPVPTLRGLGSLGCFYDPELKSRLEENHRVKLTIVLSHTSPVTKNVNNAAPVSNSSNNIITSLNDQRVTSHKLVGYYFSASWCPPCRMFTPKLVEFYNEVNSADKSIEIVFFSWDSDEGSFKDYFAKMPWIALNLGSNCIKEIGDQNAVSSIPTLIIVKDGKVVTKSGRNEVAGCHNSTDRSNLIQKWLTK
jgi:nucleoredoxin